MCATAKPTISQQKLQIWTVKSIHKVTVMTKQKQTFHVMRFTKQAQLSLDKLKSDKLSLGLLGGFVKFCWS